MSIGCIVRVVIVWFIFSKTGICQKQYKRLLIAIEVAKDKGLITFDVPFREYDYSLYKKS